jgi:hypothetical protein
MQAMAKQSTNKWSLERSRESVNVLLRKSGTEPLLVEILSDLLWVVDHQQSELERVYDWTKYIIEQALVDHAHGDGTVQINQTCHEAIKAWYYTEPAKTQEVQEVQESSVGSDAPLSDERLAVIRAMIALTDVGDAQFDAITELLAEVERLRGQISEAYGLLDAEHIQR